MTKPRRLSKAQLTLRERARRKHDDEMNGHRIRRHYEPISNLDRRCFWCEHSYFDHQHGMCPTEENT